MYREIHEPGFNLGMAVGAEKNALPRLLSDLLQRPGDASLGKSEGLLAGISMMKLECRDAAVVTAQHALSPGLLNQDLLDLPPPALHGVCAALLATGA